MRCYEGVHETQGAGEPCPVHWHARVEDLTVLGQKVEVVEPVGVDSAATVHTSMVVSLDACRVAASVMLGNGRRQAGSCLCLLLAMSESQYSAWPCAWGGVSLSIPSMLTQEKLRRDIAAMDAKHIASERRESSSTTHK